MSSMRGERPAHRRGFTLFEAILVVAIIALMAGVMAPSFSSMIDEAKVNRFVSNYQALTKGAIDYYEDTSLLPRENSRADPSTGFWQGQKFRRLSLNQGDEGWDGPYIDHLLTDADNPYGGFIGVYPDDPAWLPSGGYDFDGDGTLDCTGIDTVTFYAQASTEVAKAIDDRLDAGVAGTWTHTGRVQHRTSYSGSWVTIFVFDADGK